MDKNKRIKRPRGIFPSLPGGMDTVIKRYLDTYRANNVLPPEIQGKVHGFLMPDITLLEKWRSWRISELVYEDKENNAELRGALDDCLVDGNFYIPLDYKTRGSALTEDPRRYYQNQLDCYTLMLESCGYKTKGLAYLLYYWPEDVKENGVVKFHVEPIRIETNIESPKDTVRSAVRILTSPMPGTNGNCEFCNLAAQRKAYV